MAWQPTQFIEDLKSGYYDKNPNLINYFTTDEKLWYMEYKATGKVEKTIGNHLDDLSGYFKENPAIKGAVDKFTEFTSAGTRDLSRLGEAVNSFAEAIGISSGGGGGISVGKKK